MGLLIRAKKTKELASSVTSVVINEIQPIYIYHMSLKLVRQMPMQETSPVYLSSFRGKLCSVVPTEDDFFPTISP
jgi:hypothetical protein